MQEAEFIKELFNYLKRSLNIHGVSIYKDEYDSTFTNWMKFISLFNSVDRINRKEKRYAITVGYRTGDIKDLVVATDNLDKNTSILCKRLCREGIYYAKRANIKLTSGLNIPTCYSTALKILHMWSSKVNSHRLINCKITSIKEKDGIKLMIDYCLFIMNEL